MRHFNVSSIEFLSTLFPHFEWENMKSRKTRNMFKEINEISINKFPYYYSWLICHLMYEIIFNSTIIAACWNDVFWWLCVFYKWQYEENHKQLICFHEYHKKRLQPFVCTCVVITLKKWRRYNVYNWDLYALHVPNKRILMVLYETNCLYQIE